MLVAEMSLISKYEDIIKNDLQIVTHAINGIDADVFFDLSEISGINKYDLAEEIFDISLKTVVRYQKEGKKMSAKHSEILLQLIALYKKGIEVFDGLGYFNNWLKKSAFGLGDMVPYTLLKTSTGITMVLESLIRIEYGDLA